MRALKHLIGGFLVAAPFVGIVTFGFHTAGLAGTIVAIGVLLLIIGAFASGFWLLAQ